ncbi:MAG: hypothetical protein VX938_08560, partial [Myxococcota bacterium]|nr:hypothetical protein [Myxococcota bacterium]
MGCDLCQEAEVSVAASLDPTWAAGETVGGQEVCTTGCLLVAPEALQISVNMDCTGNAASGTVTL